MRYIDFIEISAAFSNNELNYKQKSSLYDPVTKYLRTISIEQNQQVYINIYIFSVPKNYVN